MSKALLLFSLFLAGCATTAPQSEKIFQHPPQDIPRESYVTTVPFIKQTAGYCGPATLTMAMNWAGKKVSLDQLGREVMTPGMKGTLQQDMVGAGRRHGFMAVVIEGMEALLKEVSAGHPVIVFENLALSWMPRWHYAIVTGYDLKNREIVMHSGAEADQHLDLATFERDWLYSDYWGLVILPAGELASSAPELTQVTAAAGLEHTGRQEAASKAYKAILHQWPTSLAALIGMGNIEYAQQHFSMSVDYLQLALQYHPESVAARHNLSVAQTRLRASE